MASGGGSFPTLVLKRNVQSASKVMTVAWQSVYLESSNLPFIFMGADIDLSGMLAGDTVEVRINKRLASGGTWLTGDTITYSNAQPAGHTLVHISALPSVFGVQIEMRQTAGVLLSLPCEFSDAKRLGL